MIYLYRDMDYIPDEIIRATYEVMPVERKLKASRYMHKRDKHLCVLAYWLLMYGLRKEYGITDAPVFLYGDKGNKLSETISTWLLYLLAFYFIAATGYAAMNELGVPELGDLISLAAMVFLFMLPASKLYKEHYTSNIFILELAALIGIIAAFIAGVIATFILASFGVDFGILWLLLYAVIKIPVVVLSYFLNKLFVLNITREVVSILDGKLGRYIPVSIISIVFFIAYGAITGFTPGLQFVLFYLLICTTFVIMYWLIFSGAVWTSRAMKTEAELNVASKIQHDMLPCIFPAFPDRAEFDVYASMQPAKEVGGDFYDFFLIDDDTLAVVMADVSGKGVPAALFMVIAKTLLKNNAQYGSKPKEVFEIVNNLLCENNEAGMFVTAFMGYLDIPTGKFTYVNAGHNPPLLRSGETFDWLKAKPGFVLAGMEDMFYKENEITLNRGDELFLYTDGVTEAVNRNDELFSDPKLLEIANQNLDLPLKEFTVSIKREIDKFADGAEQADDITMLSLRYKGRQPQ